MKFEFPYIGLSLFAILIVNTSILGQSPKDRNEALRIFKACIRPNRPATLECSEEFVGNVIALYDRGDHSLLKPLLDAGLSSDGGLSEELGGFYSEVVTKTPRLFLAAVKWRSMRQQRDLCWMAGAVDGSGMSSDTLHDVRRSLRAISSRHGDRLSSVANVCLAEINRANASNGR